MQLLVVFVDVGTLFTIDFDADEVLIDKFGNFTVFKHLMLHYMAPVTTAVSDGDKYSFMLITCTFKGFIAPWIPIERVIFMLLEVWRILKS
jgi:hypothetical protein